MATLQQNPSVGVAWYFNYDDPDTGGVGMTIVIDARTATVVFVDP
jgi:hypothetical protein